MFRITVAQLTDRSASLFIEGALVLGEPTSQLREILASLTSTYKEVVIDCSRLKRIDSTGVGVLVKAYCIARERDSQLGLINVAGTVREVLLLVKLLAVFDCKSTLAA